MLKNCLGRKDTDNCKKWIKSILDNYRIIRNNNLNNAIDFTMTINLLQKALHIIEHYTTPNCKYDIGKAV